MNTRLYLVISGIVGGVIGSVLTALLISPATAQKDKFSEIECTSLTVVDETGRQNVVITGGELGGRVTVNNRDGKSVVDLLNHHFGGIIVVSGGRKNVAQRGGKGKVVVWTDTYGDGKVEIFDYHGNPTGQSD